MVTKKLAQNWYMAQLGKFTFFDTSRSVAKGRLISYLKQKKVDSEKLAEKITENLDVL